MLKVASGAEIGKSQDLKRVLDTLQRDLIYKRVYLFANHPTSKFLGFRQYDGEGINEGQRLLKELLGAQTKGRVEEAARGLADRYNRTRGKQGILIFLLSQSKLDENRQEPFIFVFKCDFEDVSQVTPKEIFHHIKDAIVEKTKKGAIYPYFDGGKLDQTILRIFDEQGETQYWLDFLDLGDAPTQFVPLQDATIEEWAKTHSAQLQKYQESFKNVPVIRSLAGGETFIESGDRLSTEDVQSLIGAIVDRTGERDVTLRVGNAKITVSLKEFGLNWIIAREAGQYFILLKGANITTTGKAINPIDFAEIPNLEDAAAQLGLACRMV
ncbi:MAG TPA: DUF3900 domain-containing protein [Pyrinomonadaceae bacterium]|jgi:hypothetical protein